MRKLPTSLPNTYYLMRHGQSVANEQNIIVSLPEHGCDDAYGLSDVGCQQAVASAVASELSSDVLIYSSDFSRARQTAELAAAALKAATPIMTPALRERCFGELEFESAQYYQAVWQADSLGMQFGHGVETMTEVADRVERFIAHLGKVYCGRTILLVSHGDTLQAAQLATRKLHPAIEYHKAMYMDNAEIKLLER